MASLLNYFCRWNIEFHWELPEFMGAIVETREMHLSLQGWFAICLVPPGDTWYYDSWQQIFDEWLLPICRCACAHLSVKFSFLSQNILPNWLLFYNPTSHMRLLSVCTLSKRLCWSSHQLLYFLLPWVPTAVMPMSSIFNTWAHICFTSFST